MASEVLAKTTRTMRIASRARLPLKNVIYELLLINGNLGPYGLKVGRLILRWAFLPFTRCVNFDSTLLEASQRQSALLNGRALVPLVVNIDLNAIARLSARRRGAVEKLTLRRVHSNSALSLCGQA